MRHSVSLPCGAINDINHRSAITIPLSDERVAQLRVLAEEAGLPPEEFLRRRVEQLLDRPEQQFQEAADHLLQKNAELYRRLA